MRARVVIILVKDSIGINISSDEFSHRLLTEDAVAVLEPGVVHPGDHDLLFVLLVTRRDRRGRFKLPAPDVRYGVRYELQILVHGSRHDLILVILSGYAAVIAVGSGALACRLDECPVPEDFEQHGSGGAALPGDVHPVLARAVAGLHIEGWQHDGPATVVTDFPRLAALLGEGVHAILVLGGGLRREILVERGSSLGAVE